MKEKKRHVINEVVRNIQVAVEVITDSETFIFSQPDERNIRFMIRDGERKRWSDGFCIIERDVICGEPLILQFCAGNDVSPKYSEDVGKVQEIKILDMSREEFLDYAIKNTEKGGRGQTREFIKPCGTRRPEFFEAYRQIFLESHVQVIQNWLNMRSHLADELMRTVGMLINYFPPDGTDYIEDKFGYALHVLGYELVCSHGDEQYRPILPILPLDKIFIPEKEKQMSLTKKQIREIYIKPLIKALEVSQNHQWDKPALFLVKAVSLMLADNLKEKFNSYCREIEECLWNAAFLLGYRFIKVEKAEKAA
jgi:hypothetical protein